MAKYNVHGGHNSIVPGANKYLNEVTEDRAVKNKVIAYLKAAGHTVYDCTDDAGKTQNANLANIVAKCNRHSVDLDISIHLNAGGGTGVEVYYYSGDSAGKAKAAAVSAKIAAALGLKNRGAKATTSLYVLNSTKATAILVECCFVDNKTDAAAWDADKCARAIVEGITGKSVSTGGSGTSGSGERAVSIQLYTPNATDAQKWKLEKQADGTYMLKNVASGLYLDVKDGAAESGTPVRVYTGNKTAAQKWAIDRASETSMDRPAVIRSALADGLVLDAKDGGKASGTGIQIYTENGTTAQLWNFVYAGSSWTYYIINAVSGKALDVVNGGR